jgi:hypothetical protein
VHNSSASPTGAGGPYGNLPHGATVVEVDPIGNWVRYRLNDGTELVRFKPEEAFTESPARKHLPTDERRAGLTTDGKIEVLEGRNRAVGAALGDIIPEILGGIPGTSGWLDYLFVPLGGQASSSSSLFPILGMPKP